MKLLALAITFSWLAAGCNSAGSSTSGGSASVSGTIKGHTVVARDVVGLSGTQALDGGVTAYTGVLISDTGGTCVNAMLNGVTNAESMANVLEVVATVPGGPMTPGTYKVGYAGLAEYFYFGSNGQTSGVAGNGSITFSAISATTVSGRFDLNMAGGDRLTGTFTAPVCSGIPANQSPW
jgi:hypothetical protein